MVFSKKYKIDLRDCEEAFIVALFSCISFYFVFLEVTDLGIIFACVMFGNILKNLLTNSDGKLFKKERE